MFVAVIRGFAFMDRRNPGWESADTTGMVAFAMRYRLVCTNGSFCNATSFLF